MSFDVLVLPKCYSAPTFPIPGSILLPRTGSRRAYLLLELCAKRGECQLHRAHLAASEIRPFRAQSQTKYFCFKRHEVQHVTEFDCLIDSYTSSFTSGYLSTKPSLYYALHPRVSEHQHHCRTHTNMQIEYVYTPILIGGYA